MGAACNWQSAIRCAFRHRESSQHSAFSSQLKEFRRRFPLMAADQALNKMICVFLVNSRLAFLANCQLRQLLIARCLG